MNTKTRDSVRKIVVIGGGTGTFTVLSGIKHLPDVDITAIVTSADSGGSTGILRDEFGQLPVGDFRQCLVALAGDGNETNILRDLFQYRFAKGGSGLVGHNFGNLFITALTDILGSEENAFRQASKILNIQGRVYPITFSDIQLVAEYEDGTIAFGEDMIDDPGAKHDGTMRIRRLWTQPQSDIYEGSRKAIAEADYIIFGPGDLYTSTIANLVIDDGANGIASSHAKKIYILNLVSKWGQTHGFKSSDYINELEKYLGGRIDYIIQNNELLPESILERYALENSYPIEDNLVDTRVMRAPLLLNQSITRKTADKIKRSLIRHDSLKLAEVISRILAI